jgi:hypothetical protein
MKQEKLKFGAIGTTDHQGQQCIRKPNRKIMGSFKGLVVFFRELAHHLVFDIEQSTFHFHNIKKKCLVYCIRLVISWRNKGNLLTYSDLFGVSPTY